MWKWSVNWEFVDEAVVTEKLKPFVEKKIVEYLGVQEQMLVDVVEAHLRKRGGPGELVELLEGVLVAMNPQPAPWQPTASGYTGLTRHGLGEKVMVPGFTDIAVAVSDVLS